MGEDLVNLCLLVKSCRLKLMNQFYSSSNATKQASKSGSKWQHLCEKLLELLLPSLLPPIKLYQKWLIQRNSADNSIILNCISA